MTTLGASIILLDTLGRKMELYYYDAAQDKDTGRYLKLKKVEDFTSRTVTYDYDDDGNLIEANKYGRVWRYEYSMQSDYPNDPSLQGNLLRVFSPKEIEENSEAPKPFREYIYGTSGNEYDKVIQAFEGEKDDEDNVISGGYNDMMYYYPDDPDLPADSCPEDEEADCPLNKTGSVTRVIAKDGKVTDHYIGFNNMLLKTCQELENGNSSMEYARFSKEGLRTSKVNRDGTVSSSEHEDFGGKKYMGLERPFINKVKKNNQRRLRGRRGRQRHGYYLQLRTADRRRPHGDRPTRQHHHQLLRLPGKFARSV